VLLESKGHQQKMELVFIENLVPENHILRKIDKHIDFSFINEICRPYYCENNGRPAIEPEVMFKMLFIGYLFGIRSETRLFEEVKVGHFILQSLKKTLFSVLVGFFILMWYNNHN